MTIRERLAAAKARVVEVEAAGIGPVRLRVLASGKVLDLVKHKDQERAMLEFVAACLVDEQDQPVFASAAAVGELDWATVSALNKAAMQCNGLSIEDAGKNSETSPSSS